MSDELRTAQVVLQPGTDPMVAPERVAEVPPPADEAAAVVGWFQHHGFDTGPVVGTSFAITGSDDLFSETFGAESGYAGGQEAELPLSSLDDHVSARVAAVVTTGPPDFGPGNP